MLSLRRAGRLPARRPRVRQVSPYWTIPSAGEALDRWLLHPVRYLLWFLQADDLHGTVSARVPGGADAALVGPGARRRARGGVAGGHRPLHTVRPRPEPLGTRGIAPGGRFWASVSSGRLRTRSDGLCVPLRRPSRETGARRLQELAHHTGGGKPSAGGRPRRPGAAVSRGGWHHQAYVQEHIRVVGCTSGRTSRRRTTPCPDAGGWAEVARRKLRSWRKEASAYARFARNQS